MLNPRLDKLTDYPFERLRTLLESISPAPGMEPLVLAIGEPQHGAPPLLAETVTANGPLWDKYPPIDGTPEFRDAVGVWLARRYGLGGFEADGHVLPIAGSREALFLAAILAVPEKTAPKRPLALIPNPLYHVYVAAAAMAGADPQFLPTTRATGFLPDLGAIDAETLDRTAIFYLCSPSNPQGAVADLDYLKEAVRLARAHDFVLCVDECYAEIYLDAPPPGGLEACAAMGPGFDNVLVFHSLSKRSSAPGLRSGFVAGDPRLIAPFKTLRAFGGVAMPMPVLAASAALWSDETHAGQSRALYQAKFDAAGEALAGRLGYVRPGGGFFLWLEVGDDIDAARRLWAEAALRVLPGSYLGRTGADGANPGAGYIRVALVHDLKTTKKALSRLIKVLC